MQKTANEKMLEQILGVKLKTDADFATSANSIQGILQTTDYNSFSILDDGGRELHRFDGAKLANRCLAGDHVVWSDGKCVLELRDEHPPIVGTIELTNKTRYGLTSRGIPIYLFTPYNKCYPPFIVGCSEKDTTKNRIGLIKFDDWNKNSTFPRGQLQQVLGVSGDFNAEKQALIWQACPVTYPKGPYPPPSPSTAPRRRLSGYTFNIDPPGCKDVDDVLTFEERADGTWHIIVTISDVAAYVEDGGVIDIYASLIGQTLYDKGGTVIRPMLPQEYSEHACSLISGKERDSYGISLECVWDGTQLNNMEWYESILKTDRSYTYEEFQNSDSPYRRVLSDIASYLAKERLEDSHEWIEQMMLLYNKEAGRALKAARIGILRSHSAPDLKRLERYRIQSKELERLAFKSAKYCLAEETNTIHYGLQTDTYAHASSPIRRYADLVNQRALKCIFKENTTEFIVPISMYDMNHRAKLNKNFERDMDFLLALTTDSMRFTGIILNRVRCLDNGGEYYKIKMYIPAWQRTISTKYKYVDENTVLSRDETRQIDVTEFKEVVFRCTFNMKLRNWKERAIICIE